MVWKFISLYCLQASGSGIEVERVDSGVGSEIKLDATIENKVREVLCMNILCFFWLAIENFASSECDIIQIVRKVYFWKEFEMAAFIWNSIPK